jgi:hypothetical protein
MSNEVTPTPAARPLDEFDGYTDEVVGEDEQISERAIQGQRVKFTNDGAWLLTDDATPLTKKVVAANVKRAVIKWNANNKPETRFLAPGEPVPSIKALNEEAPRSEWREGLNGQPQGPYQFQQLVYLVDPVGLDKYTFATATIGGGIAVRELVDRIQWLRRFRGPGTYPLVHLAKKPMKTKHGIRPRPHFEIVEWIVLDPSSGMIPTDDPRQLPSPAKPAETPGAKALDAAPLKTVKPPNLSEDLNDEIGF